LARKLDPHPAPKLTSTFSPPASNS
jgi:hypothetical protein